MTKPDLLGNFSQSSRIKHVFICTLPQPQPFIKSLQCMHNAQKFTELIHFFLNLEPLWPNLIFSPLLSLAVSKACHVNHNITASTPHKLNVMHALHRKIKKTGLVGSSTAVKLIVFETITIQCILVHFALQ